MFIIQDEKLISNSDKEVEDSLRMSHKILIHPETTKHVETIENIVLIKRLKEKIKKSTNKCSKPNTCGT